MSIKTIKTPNGHYRVSDDSLTNVYGISIFAYGHTKKQAIEELNKRIKDNYSGCMSKEEHEKHNYKL